VKKEEFFNAEVSKIGRIARDCQHGAVGLWRGGYTRTPHRYHRSGGSTYYRA
jgi:hypothetical protein